MTGLPVFCKFNASFPQNDSDSDISIAKSFCLFPLSDSDRLAWLKMGTEPIQNLAIATLLSLSLSGNGHKEIT